MPLILSQAGLLSVCLEKRQLYSNKTTRENTHKDEESVRDMDKVKNDVVQFHTYQGNS